MGERYPSLPYGKPFDKSSLAYKAFAAKRKFTLEEFACLLAGVNPCSFDGSMRSDSVKEEKIGPFVRLLEEEINDKKFDDCPF